MKETAFEWHNPDTGHCYVDYVPHNLMDENNGYVKTPLYKHDKITAIIGHDFESIVNQEVEKRIKERMPSDDERHAAASEHEHKESFGYSEMDKLTGLYRNIDFEAGADWACSRLTNPGVNDSQKTEGGGE